VQTSILFVEDDDGIRIALRLNLEDEGYHVIEATSGEQALELARTEQVDLAIVDLLLPGMHGFDVVRSLRDTSRTPIVILTAQSDTHDVVAGLEAGADDYLTKPIAPKELAARLRALLRRVQAGAEPVPEQPKALVVGPVEVRPAAGEAFLEGRALSLTKTEFKILCELAERPGEIVTREDLLERVWGYDYLGDGRLVDSQISRLRSMLGDGGAEARRLVTLRGMGYKLLP
jgi:DNA-binding response OmpR family regulator